MKTLLVLWLAVGLLTFSRAATTPVTNLVANGSFETGDLTSWTGTNATINTNGTNHNCVIADHGTLQQLITTTVGTQYYIAADVSVSGATDQATMAVQAGAGGAIIGSRVSTLYPIPGYPPRIGFVFTATTATTNVIFVAPNDNFFTPTTTVDNVVVYEMVPSTFAGRYSGRSIQTTNLLSPDTAGVTYTGRVVARVTPEGLIYMVGTSFAGGFEGVIFNDGTLEFPNGSGKAKIKDHVITFTFPGVSLQTSGVTGADASNTTAATITFPSTETLVLTRVGK